MEKKSLDVATPCVSEAALNPAVTAKLLKGVLEALSPWLNGLHKGNKYKTSGRKATA